MINIFSEKPLDCITTGLIVRLVSVQICIQLLVCKILYENLCHFRKHPGILTSGFYECNSGNDVVNIVSKQRKHAKSVLPVFWLAHNPIFIHNSIRSKDNGRLLIFLFLEINGSFCVNR